MRIHLSSNEAIEEMAGPAWKATRTLRGRLHHGFDPCPQHQAVFHRAEGDHSCDRCVELMELALMIGRARLAKLGVGWVEADDLRARTYRLAPSWALDARDKLSGELGMTVRPKRLPEAKWFRDAVPDADDQQIVIGAVFYTRSGDAQPHGGEHFPYETLGRSLGLDAVATRDRFLAALAAIAEARPEWVDANIVRPLSRRLAEAQADADPFRCEGVNDEHDMEQDDDIDDEDYYGFG